MRSEATAVIEHTSSGMWPKTAVLRGRGREYFARGPQDAPSLKAVTSGTATWSAHGRRFVLSERMHLVMAAGEYEVEIDTPCEDTETLCIFFEPGFLDDIGSRFDDEPRKREWPECVEPWDERVWPLLAQLATTPASESLIVSIAEALVPATEGPREELRRRVLRGRDYLLASLGDHVVLQDAARAADMSPYHFHRTFRETFGAPPHRWLLAKRLERAAHLLRTTTRHAHEIALDCGFESVPSFTTAFRRRFGAPPARWRSHEEVCFRPAAPVRL